jgi:CO/xanthine dehydrogenase FAD-binding subunit
MTAVERPRSLADALDLRARYADAVAIAGGTDVMVEVNGGRRRPERMIDLTGVPELLDWERRDGAVRLGAGVPYARLISELSGQLPGLAHAARTVGSPQIRNRGTIGGNLATASPAGDALPPLVAVDAVIEVASQRGGRTIAIGDFLLGPKRTSLAPDELVVAVDIPAARGPQVFSKVGARNAMVIAVASFALDLDPSGRVGAAIGSAGPTVLRAPEAEAFLAGALAAGEVDGAVAARFGELCAAAARPIDDLRGTAAYRRHAVGVMARRAVTWAMAEIEEADA